MRLFKDEYAVIISYDPTDKCAVFEKNHVGKRKRLFIRSYD